MLRAGVMDLALLCGLLVMAGVTPAQGGILNLNKMIKQVTGKSPLLHYWTYGCHCGPGGKGQPRDATDWCCQKHDCCYDRLRDRECRPRMDHYNYTFHEGNVQCPETGSWCEQQLCACDKEVALCLHRNGDTYRKRLRFYRRPSWRSRCQDITPTC